MNDLQTVWAVERDELYARGELTPEEMASMNAEVAADLASESLWGDAQ